MEPEGDVIKGIVVGALKDEETKSAIAPWFALWFSRENAWPVFDSYGIQAADLLPHISGATDVLARHFSDKQNVAKSAHHLVRNLLSMISSGNHIDANVLASFHINGAKLFWKSRMFSTRTERSVPLEDDTPSESDKFEKDSDSDEPLDLADEFDVTRSYRIFESLHRHHRQIESESF